MINILISGYYGFDNFGDDAILHVLVSELKKTYHTPSITVISNNPRKVSKVYGVESIYRFNFGAIIQKMKDCDVFISGGGSLLQDATSFRSFLYYLGLIHMANDFDKKSIVYGQGIGPISTIFARFLTRKVLLNSSFVAVRDRESQNFLKQIRVDSTLVTDPVWNLSEIERDTILQADKENIGVQLREWKTLSDKTINIIADTIEAKFNNEKYRINLIALQESQDLRIMQKLKNILLEKNLKSEIRIYSTSYLSIQQSLNLFGSLDYLIAMRYHACLAAINFRVPTLALSYDPKVKHLALESKIPFLNVDAISKNKEVFSNKIDELLSKHNEIRAELKQFSGRKNQLCKDDLKTLVVTINKALKFG